MTERRNNSDHGKPQATIKMPTPPSAEMRLQAKLEAAGFSPDVFQIMSVQKTTNDDGTGTATIGLHLSLKPEEAERLITALTIKNFDPDKNTVVVGNAEVTLDSVEEGVKAPEPPAKPWTGKEHSKRSKPKGEIPDFT